jgi:ribokinase
MYDVITIGSATRDVFIRSVSFKTVRARKLEHIGFPTGEAECFPLGGKIEIQAPVFTIGGGAANAAVTFARQGLKTASLFKIGADDEAGRAVLADLKKEKVVAMPIFDRRAMTSFSVVLLAPTGERTILNHRGASEDMRTNELPISKLKARVGYIVPGRIPLSVLMSAVRAMKKGGALLVMDPSSHYLEMGLRRLKPLLDALDIIKMNREEAAHLTGVHYEDEAGIFRKLDKLVGGIAVMTDGPRGVLLSDGKRIYRAGIYKEKAVIDRTGAGDAFGSGLVAALIQGARSWELGVRSFKEEDIKRAIRLGSANGTSVVEHIGAQPGILTIREFRSQSRWKDLRISVKNF